MQEEGFIDTYRFIHPVIDAKTLGHTWTTVGQGYTYVSDKGFVPVDENPSPETRDPYARIDYIYCTGDDLVPMHSSTILHHSSNEIRSFPEFPSDHAAVVTKFIINN